MGRDEGEEEVAVGRGVEGGSSDGVEVGASGSGSEELEAGGGDPPPPVLPPPVPAKIFGPGIT